MEQEAPQIPSFEGTTDSLEAAVAAMAAEKQPSETPPEKKGRGGHKPWTTLRAADGSGPFVAIYENKNKEGQSFFKFTVGRTVKKGDEFKTAYAFRFADMARLIDLLQDGRNLVVKTAYEQANVSS